MTVKGHSLMIRFCKSLFIFIIWYKWTIIGQLLMLLLVVKGLRMEANVNLSIFVLTGITLIFVVGYWGLYRKWCIYKKLWSKGYRNISSFQLTILLYKFGQERIENTPVLNEVDSPELADMDSFRKLLHILA